MYQISGLYCFSFGQKRGNRENGSWILIIPNLTLIRGFNASLIILNMLSPANGTFDTRNIDTGRILKYVNAHVELCPIIKRGY